MKPKDLKSPLQWENRRPLIDDRVFYVPQYYDKYQEWKFPGWVEIFGSEAPIEIEYCAGNGAWIIDKALTYPEKHWVAVEQQFERVRKIWSKMHNFKLSNLLIVCGEAWTFTHFYVPDASIDAIYVNFPDPWPKEKHAKKRLIQEPFISEMARVLRSEKTAMIVTDHSEYTRQITQKMCAHPSWKPQFISPHFTTEWEAYGTSYFDQLWKEQGVPVHYIPFTKL